jgi:hypothetical protein
LEKPSSERCGETEYDGFHSPSGAGIGCALSKGPSTDKSALKLILDRSAGDNVLRISLYNLSYK